MADISNITLPNGNNYTLKDSRVDSIGAGYNETAEALTFVFPNYNVTIPVVSQDSNGVLSIS